MMSAFNEKGNYKGEIQNPLNAMLSIAVKNEKINNDILAQKYDRYLSSMDSEVGGIINDYKVKLTKSSEKIDVINLQYKLGKIKSVENRDAQIRDVQEEYNDLKLELQADIMEIVADAKDPIEMINKLKALKIKTQKKK
jgi:hypothetical protein